MQQEAIIFFHELRGSNAVIDSQINKYLVSHPERKIVAISYAIGGSFEKALVIFDIKEEKECNNERGKQSSQKSAHISKPNGGGSSDDYKPAFGETKRKSDH